MYSTIRPVGLAITLLLLGSTAVVLAQSKPALKHSDYESWNSTTGVRLAPDGKSIVYTFIPAEGDGAVVIRHLASDKEFRLPSGGKAPASTAPAPAAPAATPPAGPAAPTGLPSYTPDSKFLVLSLAPPRSAVEKAKAEKKKTDEQPRPVVTIVNVATGKIVTTLDKVRSFGIHGTGAGYLVYLREAAKAAEQPKAKSETPKPKEEAPKPQAKEESKSKKDDLEPDLQQPATKGPATGGTRSTPTELVVRNMADNSETVFPGVTDFTITKDATQVVYVVSGRNAEKPGVFITPLGESKPEAIQPGSGRYTRLTWNEEQTRLAFFVTEGSSNTSTKDEEGKVEAEESGSKLRVMLWERSDKFSPAKEVLGPNLSGLKEGWTIQERGGLSFSRDGLKLILATGPTPPPAPKTAEPSTPPAGSPPAPGSGRFGRGGQAAATRTSADRIDLDLWHWKDEALQPMQKIRGTAERTRTYRAVYLLDSKKLVQLADEDKDVSVPNYGDWALANSDKRYRGQLWRSPLPRDWGLLNIRTGEAKPLAQEVTGSISLAPKGGYVLQFDGQHWTSTRLPDGKPVNLTEKLKVKFFDEEFDTPTTPRPYSGPLWTSDEKHVLLSDKYDLWKFALDGSSVENLTKIGREMTTRFRIIRVEGESETDDGPGIDLSKPFLLAAENLLTRDTGFYRMNPSEKPKMLVMGARRYGTPTKAKNADTMIFTVSTFYDYPDYYTSEADFREIKRVTDINPKVREFNWGKAEIVSYKNIDGVPLTGILIKPEDFDPTKQYPMMVYIYERLSQNVHNFVMPRAGTSINPTYYASNGYLVFMPDIVYTIGSPGQSALKCVLPAIQAVVDKGFVKEDAIGIQGHSWGGYQIAYMVTQTNRFKAANAGAPVANMISAYGGIRWGSGLPRQFQYEHTQSRIGGTLWGSTLKYIENSPVFLADRVSTPLMMLHNDQDDAVPWYQGIEYYLALRRLGKEVYLFNYNGEFHGLRKKATQQDYTVRMQQFFDHHLKGEPAPEWMEKGIPYREREQEKEQWKKLFEPVKN